MLVSVRRLLRTSWWLCLLRAALGVLLRRLMLLAAAPADAQKRRRAGGGSAKEPREARGSRISQEDLSRLSAMAVTLREDLRHIYGCA